MKTSLRESARPGRGRNLPIAAMAAMFCALAVPLASFASVFDDVKVWYRGALAAESYYSNGPEGTLSPVGTLLRGSVSAVGSTTTGTSSRL